MGNGKLVCIGSGSLMVLAAFLPWAQQGILTVAGIQGDGVFTLAAGVVVIVAALAGRRGWPAVMLAGVAALYIAWTVIGNLDTDNIGTGLLLTGVAAIAAVIGGIGLRQEPVK